MSTLTATTAAEQLLADVRQMLARHDGAETVDELRELADELSTALRRVRGRISRLAKREQPAAPEQQSQQPAPPPSPVEPSVVTPAAAPEKHPVADPLPKVERTAPMTSSSQTPAPQPAAEPSPRKRRHFFRWFFLAVQALFLMWIIGGVNSASDNCDGEVGAALDACRTAVGAGIGAGLIIGLWVAVDVILGITYLIFRKR